MKNTTTHPLIQLAPMQGVMDPYLREVYSSLGGYDFMVTEFIRVTQSLLPDKVFYKYSPELKNKGLTTHKTPVYIQLLGSDPQLLSENAHKAAELGAPGIDLNFGCPAKTVNRHRGGSVLLKEPELLYKIAHQIRLTLPHSIPLTGKIRLGYEDKNLFLENAQALEAAGVSWVTVHARTKLEGYQPPAHWEYVRLIRESLKIPVFNNGEIWNLSDYQQACEVSGGPHVALGRGALAHPFLALNLKNPHLPPQDWAQVQKSQILQNFVHLCHQEVSEAFALSRLKQWLSYLKRSFPEAVDLFEKIKTQKQLSNIIKWLRSNDCYETGSLAKPLPGPPLAWEQSNRAHPAPSSHPPTF